ncbi:17.4 kDa class III heat shock protein [Andrographis paniculata]|uniref:17.4 kDa class III heat shock protein n=1 Tax=Andrographis paniculata TaxID=175694 RepID=UPI0021E72E9B|nr:17.4 kDa class III heat shock protein [Andrographis paniculata]
MSSVVEAMTELLNFPDAVEKLMHSASRSNDSSTQQHLTGGGSAGFPADILETPKEYLFYVDVPGLSKSDIQVTVEDENTLVLKSNGKRKRENGLDEEEGCKYIRLERKPPAAQKLMRKFRLPENCNLSAISAKCENGVLTVVVEKLPPPPSKSKTVQIAIS